MQHATQQMIQPHSKVDAIVTFVTVSKQWLTLIPEKFTIFVYKLH